MMKGYNQKIKILNNKLKSFVCGIAGAVVVRNPAHEIRQKRD